MMNLYDKLEFTDVSDGVSYAAFNGYAGLMSEMLDDERVTIPHLNAALEIAMMRDHRFVVMELLADGRVDPTLNDNQCIRYAVFSGYTNIVKILLEDRRADPCVENNLIFRHAVWHGYVEIVKMLLKDGRADPTVNNNFALAKACEHDHDDLVEALIFDGRADPSINNNMLIAYAAEYLHSDNVAKLLKDPRVDPGANDNYALVQASKCWRLTTIGLLLPYCGHMIGIRDYNEIKQCLSEDVEAIWLNCLTTNALMVRLVVEKHLCIDLWHRMC